MELNINNNIQILKNTQSLQITWKKIKEAYGGLIWIVPGIVVVHELSHIIVGKGLNMQNGWYGLSVHGEITQAMYGIIGVYVNEVTPFTFAAGLIGSLIFVALLKRHGSRIGFHVTGQTFWAGVLYAVWIAKWDLKWLTAEFLRILIQ